MNGLMNSASFQIQSTKTVAINEQDLPQLPASLWSTNRQPPHRGWNFPDERPEGKSKDTFSKNVRSGSRDELLRNLNHDEEDGATHYIYR